MNVLLARIQEPYWYESECLEALKSARNDGIGRALVVMASGLGKTVVAAFDIKSFLERFGGRVLFLVHQNDILDQAYETFVDVLGEGYGFGYMHGTQKDLEYVDVLFASFQTMRLWRDSFEPDTFAYIVVDESHHTPAETYLPTLEYFNPKFLLGITATPERTDLQDIRKVYGEEVYSLPLEDALAQGLLTPVDYRLLTDEIQNLSVLKTPIGRLSVKKLNRSIFIPKRDHEIARIIREKTADISPLRMMVFAPSIEYCGRIAPMLPNALPIHDKISAGEQTRALGAFRSGEIETIVTVDKFNEGIDVPEINVIVFLRATSSRTIFYQQLGRGLRKSPGLEKVLVLDFVANCERLEMIHKLWTLVERKHKKHKPHSEEEPLVVDIGHVSFDEVARDVLDILRKIRLGYTREVIVQQIHNLVLELGHVPSRKDVANPAVRWICVHPLTMAKYFGSFHEAIRQAGYEPLGEDQDWSEKTDEEMLDELRSLHKSIGRVPSAEDIDKASKQGLIAHSSRYRRRYGSVPNARVIADIGDLESERIRSQIKKSDRQMIRELQKLAKKLGHTPSGLEINEASRGGKISHSSTYRERFGSLNNVRGLAKLDRLYFTNQRIADSKMIEDIRTLAKRLGHLPNTTEIDTASRRKECAHSRTYRAHFGQLSTLYKLAGLIDSEAENK